MRLIRLPLSIAGATLLFTGCPDDTTTTGLSGTDAVAETSSDGSTSGDAAADSVQDAAPDGTVDATPDQGAPDVAADSAVDATPDPGTPDVQLDAADDVALDSQGLDTSIADAEPDGVQSDGGSGDVSVPDAAQDVGAPDIAEDSSMPDAMADVAEDIAQPDADLDASNDGEVACWTPTDQEMQELVGHPCEAEYDFQGFCDDSNQLVVGCSAGTWQPATNFPLCDCVQQVPNCGPYQLSCIAIGYVGIAQAGAERHGGVSLRMLS